MSFKAMLMDALASDGDDFGPPKAIVVIRQPTKFDKLCDSLAKTIVSWKDGSVAVTENQCREALSVIDVIKERHPDLQSKTSALSEQIIQIQSQLASEVLLRKQKEQELQSQIDVLKADNESLIRIRDEGQRVMLVRALGTSFQYALTQKFPGVFTTKYPFSCTFDNIDRKVTALNDATFDATLASVKAFFTAREIQVADINVLIKNIREIGTSTSNMTEVIDSNGVAFNPSAADLHGVINAVALSDSIKDDARILLDALNSIVPTHGDLLYIV